MCELHGTLPEGKVIPRGGSSISSFRFFVSTCVSWLQNLKQGWLIILMKQFQYYYLLKVECGLGMGTFKSSWTCVKSWVVNRGVASKSFSSTIFRGNPWLMSSSACRIRKKTRIDNNRPKFNVFNQTLNGNGRKLHQIGTNLFLSYVFVLLYL